MSWRCPRCGREFRQVNQRHACGLGDREELLQNRPAGLVGLYDELESAIRGFGPVEVVTRNRYALFRTSRIFVDLTVMRDCLRVVIHLARRVEAPWWDKIVAGSRRTSHVVKIRTGTELEAIEPLLREAWELAVAEE